MASLDVKALIRILEGLRRRLYALYVNVLDLGVSDTLHSESLLVEHLITELRKLLPAE